MENKRIIEIWIKPVDIDYHLIFSDDKLFNERRKVLLNSYIIYLTSGKYEIAEEFKSLITDLELSKELYVEDQKEISKDITDIIPEIEEKDIAKL